MNRSLVTTQRVLATAVLAAGLALGDAATAAEADFAALGKDVQILAQVLETATAPDRARRDWERGGTRVEGLYLAGQGMVFRVRMRGGHFEHAFFEAPLPPIPPVPAVGIAGAGIGHEDVLIESEEAGEIIEEAMMEAHEAMGEMGFSGMDQQARTELRALREAQRGAAREYRDRQRAYALAMRGDKPPAQAERDRLRAAAETARKDFDASNEKLRARLETLRTEQRQRWLAKVQKTETDLLDALCSYAGSTRRLKASEHVSLVLDGDHDDEDGRHRIWVIRKSDLDACASNDQAADFLQKKATNYVL